MDHAGALVDFNSISVDGDMSTNDTVVVLANGASGISEISQDKR
jgi:glutamate N-acetyltransferase/amino-acid N-acetyltransferase